jgi:four helix bundle protein
LEPAIANCKLQISNCKLQIEANRIQEQIEVTAMKPDDLLERLLDFGARVGLVVDALPNTRLGRHVASQLVRCGTSPLPNYEEACAAESRADFIHKLRICLKETRETRSWIRLIIRPRLLPAKRMTKLLDEATQLCNILGQSVVTATQNSGRKKGPPINK